MTPPKTVTVRYTPFRYTGWRRAWRKLTFRPVESPTYEFEALAPEHADAPFSFRPVGPVRKVEP